MLMLVHLVHIYIQVLPNLRFAKNLVFNIIERFADNVQIITFAFFLSFWINLGYLNYRNFTIFIALLIKSTNIIIFRILLIAFLLSTRRASSSYLGLWIKLRIQARLGPSNGCLYICNSKDNLSKTLMYLRMFSIIIVNMRRVEIEKNISFK